MTLAPFREERADELRMVWSLKRRPLRFQPTHHGLPAGWMPGTAGCIRRFRESDHQPWVSRFASNTQATLHTGEPFPFLVFFFLVELAGADRQGRSRQDQERLS